MIKYIRFPFKYDTLKMQQEVQSVSNTWIQHFNTADYEGSWSGISLRSPGGITDNLFVQSFGVKAPFADTPLLLQCPYIAEVIASFQCEKTSVRLLNLAPGAVIKEHSDVGLNFEEGEARLHIPVVTDPLVEFYLDGDRLLMNEGTCWYINASLPHRLANHSDVNRIHLVIDCMVNDWLQEQFSREDLPVKSIKDTSVKEQHFREQMIRELRLSGDPVRMKLADDLEQQQEK